MDGLSGAASLIQVISLAIQLGDSVFKFSRALKSIRNASKDLQVLAKDLERLRGILSEVAWIAQEQQNQSIASPPSVNLYTALENCRMRFEALEVFATKLNASLQRKGMQKTLGALKIPGRRGTLRDLQTELDRSIEHLGTLLILNTTKINLMHLEQTEKLVTPSDSPMHSTIMPLPISPSHPTQGPMQCLVKHVSKQATAFAKSIYKWRLSSATLTSGTLLGLVQYCIIYKELCLSRQGDSISRQPRSMKLQDWSIILFFWSIGRYFQFQTRMHSGQVERRWRICPLDPQRTSPTWILCRNGDTQGLLKLFSQGWSPYVQDGQGNTLLNVALHRCYPELCRLLLHLGLDFSTHCLARSLATCPDGLVQPAVSDIERVWNTMRVFQDPAYGLDTLISVFEEEGLIYYGQHAMTLWWAGSKYSVPKLPISFPQPDILEEEILILAQSLMHGHSPTTLLPHEWLTKFIIRRLGQDKFSLLCEKSMLVIEAVFLLREEEITDENQWALEADSERLGRNWCLTLEKCGLDAEAHVQSMIGINGGRDVYLESIDCGERGFAIRSLLKGTAREPALRWEWSLPPKQNGRS